MEVILCVVASARTAVNQGRFAPLTASSLRLLSFDGGAGAPPFLVVPESDFVNFP